MILARALGRTRSLRGEGPRQRAGVHGQARTGALPRPGARGRWRGARAVLVGSRHTAESLWEAIDDERRLPERTRLGPPGRGRRAASAPARTRRGDVRGRCPGRRPAARPRVRRGRRAPRAPSPATRAQAGAALGEWGRGRPAGGVRRQADRQQGPRPAARGLAAGAGARAAGAPGGGRLRGLPRGPGADRARALQAGELERARELALRRARAGGRRGRSPSRCATCSSSWTACGRAGASATWRRPAALSERVLFTGRLEHEELAELLPACSAMVVPSTFPEAFGMVAAEAAACGALPDQRGPLGARGGQPGAGRAVSRRRSAHWLSFELGRRRGGGDRRAARSAGWRRARPCGRATREGLVATVRERWSWEGVARGVIAAARGELRGSARSLRRDRPRRRALPPGTPAVRIVFARAMCSAGSPARSIPSRLAAASGCVALPRCCRSLAALALAASGCSVKGADNANLIVGKQQFVAKCGACHTLARADTKGIVGPEPRRSLPREHRRRARAQHDPQRRRMPDQIPNPEGAMPKDLVSGATAKDVAAYVEQSAAAPGTDTGLLASAVEAPGAGKPAVEKARQAGDRRQPRGPARIHDQQGRPRAPGPVTVDNAQHVRRHRTTSPSKPAKTAPRQGPQDRRQPVHLEGHRLGHTDPQARQVHVLLRGPRAPRGGHVRHPDRQIARRARAGLRSPLGTHDRRDRDDDDRERVEQAEASPSAAGCNDRPGRGSATITTSPRSRRAGSGTPRPRSAAGSASRNARSEPTALEDVDGRVDDEPHDVDEVPVDPGHLDAAVLLGAVVARGRRGS